MFSSTNLGFSDNYVSAVYCEDLFAEQIAAETNSESQFYTQTFADEGG